MKYIKKEILKKLSKNLTLKDRILLFIFGRYTYIIYSLGYQSGFNFYSNVDNVNDLSTLNKLQ